MIRITRPFSNIDKLKQEMEMRGIEIEQLPANDAYVLIYNALKSDRLRKEELETKLRMAIDELQRLNFDFDTISGREIKCEKMNTTDKKIGDVSEFAKMRNALAERILFEKLFDLELLGRQNFEKIARFCNKLADAMIKERL